MGLFILTNCYSSKKISNKQMIMKKVNFFNTQMIIYINIKLKNFYKKYPF